MNVYDQKVEVELDPTIEDIDFNITLSFCFGVDEINDAFIEIQSEEDGPIRSITQSEYSNIVYELSRYIEDQLSYLYDNYLYKDGEVSYFINDHLSNLI